MKELNILGHWEIFNKKFTIYGTINSPLFLAKEVAKLIEHTQVVRMIDNIDSNEKVMNNVHTLGGIQNCWFLTENGLYEVLMQSRKPIAKQFKTKVKEILKEIRKTGSYSMKPQQQSLEPVFTPAVRTYRGRRVVTLQDIVKATGKSEGTVQHCIRCKSAKCKEGTDFHVLKGDELRHFKKENGMRENHLGKLTVVLESGFLKLCKYFGILPNSTGCFLVESQPKPEVALPRPEPLPTKLLLQFDKSKKALIALDVALDVYKSPVRSSNQDGIEALRNLAVNVVMEITQILRLNDQLRT